MSVYANHDKKYAFMHIPKTGGTSIRAVLLEDRCECVLTGHLSMNQILEKRPELSDYMFFTVIRNPYDRAHSMWSFFRGSGVVPNMLFDEFILDHVWKNKHKDRHFLFSQDWYIGGWNIEMLRFHSLQEDFAQFQCAFDIKGSLPHRNSRPRCELVWTDRFLEAVEDRYEDDFELDQWEVPATGIVYPQKGL